MDPPQKKIKLETVALRYPPPVAVLDDEYYDDIEAVDVYIGRVINKAHISGLMQQLKTVFPITGSLSHLKRVKGDEIILTRVENCDKNICMDIVEKKLQGLQSVIDLRRVPAKLSKTKRQHEQANALWPCNFHPSNEIEMLLSQTFFSTDQVDRLYEYMRLALNIAEKNRAFVGAVVVNPRSGQVVATGHDERTRNPCYHAVMVVLDKVANIQRDLFRNVELQTDEERRKTRKEDLPYLCTGYDLFVTREPCIMCAMAMVHSRVRRVFYGYQSEHGALGTKCKVHTRAALNHHYLVFRNILSDECKTLEKFREIC